MCPRCHAEDCEHDPIQVVDKMIEQKARCIHCELEWLEVYTLAGYVVTHSRSEAAVFTLMDLAVGALATAEEQCEGCGEDWKFLEGDTSEHVSGLDGEGLPITQGCTASLARDVVEAIKVIK